MRDKIVFFILGAILATTAYFAGDMRLSADNPQDEFKVIPKLLVKELLAESIQVGYKDTYQIRMGFDKDSAKIGLLPSNGKQLIGIFVTKETGDDAAFIGIGNDMGKFRFMNASGVDTFGEPPEGFYHEQQNTQ